MPLGGQEGLQEEACCRVVEKTHFPETEAGERWKERVSGGGGLRGRFIMLFRVKTSFVVCGQTIKAGVSYTRFFTCLPNSASYKNIHALYKYGYSCAGSNSAVFFKYHALPPAELCYVFQDAFFSSSAPWN